MPEALAYCTYDSRVVDQSTANANLSPWASPNLVAGFPDSFRTRAYGSTVGKNIESDTQAYLFDPSPDIPVGATIVGITLVGGGIYYGYDTTVPGISDLEVRLVLLNAGSYTGAEIGGINNITTTDTLANYEIGGLADIGNEMVNFGRTPTVAEINSSDFAITLRAAVAGVSISDEAWIYIDSFRVLVEYTIPVGNDIDQGQTIGNVTLLIDPVSPDSIDQAQTLDNIVLTQSNVLNVRDIAQVPVTGIRGAEVLTNPSFDTMDDWVLGAGWDIDAGQANLGHFAPGELYQTLATPTVVGKTYFVAWHEVVKLLGRSRVKLWQSADTGTMLGAFDSILDTAVDHWRYQVFVADDIYDRLSVQPNGYTGLAVSEISFREINDITLTESLSATVVPNDSDQAQTIDPANLTEHNVLALLGAGQAQVIDPATLAEHNILAPNDADQGQDVDAVTLTEKNLLAPVDTDQSQALGAVAIIQKHILGPDDSDQVQDVDGVTLSQQGIIGPDDSDQAQTLDGVTVTQKHILGPDDSEQLQTLDGVNLTEANSVSPGDTDQAQDIDPAELTEHNILGPDDADQLQTLDEAALVSAGVLDTGEVNQAQTLGGLVLTQAHIMTPEDLAQLQTLDGVLLTQAHIIALDDLDQAGAIDNITLGVLSTVAPDDTTQAASLDEGNLTEHNILAPADVVTGQSIGGVTLTASGALSIFKLLQASGIDAINLTQAGIIVVNDAGQAQTVDGVALAQNYQILIDELVQTNQIDNITLTAAALGVDPDDIYQTGVIDNIDLTEFAIISASNLTQGQILDIVSLGGIVVGELDGTVRVFALIDGRVTGTELISGNVNISEILSGKITLH